MIVPGLESLSSPRLLLISEPRILMNKNIPAREITLEIRLRLINFWGSEYFLLKISILFHPCRQQTTRKNGRFDWSSDCIVSRTFFPIYIGELSLPEDPIGKGFEWVYGGKQCCYSPHSIRIQQVVLFIIFIGVPRESLVFVPFSIVCYNRNTSLHAIFASTHRPRGKSDQGMRGNLLSRK